MRGVRLSTPGYDVPASGTRRDGGSAGGIGPAWPGWAQIQKMLSSVKTGGECGPGILPAWPGRDRPMPGESLYFKELEPVWDEIPCSAAGWAKRRAQKQIDNITLDSDSYRA